MITCSQARHYRVLCNSLLHCCRKEETLANNCTDNNLLRIRTPPQTACENRYFVVMKIQIHFQLLNFRIIGRMMIVINRKFNECLPKLGWESLTWSSVRQSLSQSVPLTVPQTISSLELKNIKTASEKTNKLNHLPIPLSCRFDLISLLFL